MKRKNTKENHADKRKRKRMMEIGRYGQLLVLLWWRIMKTVWLISRSVELGANSFSVLPTSRSWTWELGARLMKRAIILARAWAPDYLPQGTPGTNWIGSLTCLVLVLLQRPTRNQMPEQKPKLPTVRVCLSVDRFYLLSTDGLQ